MARPDSPLADCMPTWAIRELQEGCRAALTGISNFNLASEVPVNLPDPLGGIYPDEPPQYGRRR
jgi:hypothetical protein